MQPSVLGLVLFNILISDLEKVKEYCLLTKSADKMKLGVQMT